MRENHFKVTVTKIVKRLQKERVLLLLILLILGLVLFAPLYYDFTYPSAGPDTASRVEELSRATEDLGYVANLWYYSPLFLLPFTELGVSSLTAYTVFSYLVVIGSLLCVYLLVRHYYGRVPATLSLLGMLLVGFGFLYLFRAGTVYHLLTLYIIIPALIYSVIRYLRVGGSNKWAIPSILLIVLISFSHPIGYAYTEIALSLFLAGYWLYHRGKDSRSNKPIILIIAVILTIPMAWLTWGSDTALSYIGYEYAGGVSSLLPVNKSPLLSVLYFLGIPLGVALGGGYLVWRNKEVRKKLNQPVTYLLLAYLLAVIVPLIGTGKERLMLDLSVFLTIAGAISIGTYLTVTSASVSRELIHSLVRIGLVIVAIVVIPISVYNWTADYTALRPVDKEAIEFLNEQDRELEVLVSLQVDWRIYRVYTDNIEYRWLRENSDPSRYDYVIYRDRYMVSRVGYYGQVQPTFSPPVLEELEKVRSFKVEGISISIYKGS